MSGAPVPAATTRAGERARRVGHRRRGPRIPRLHEWHRRERAGPCAAGPGARVSPRRHDGSVTFPTCSPTVPRSSWRRASRRRPATRAPSSATAAPRRSRRRSSSRARWSTARGARRHALVAFRGGFHGRTAYALAATFTPSYREPFEPLVPGVRFCDFNDPAGLDAVLDDDVFAVLLEPVQGEGGAIPATREFHRDGARARHRAPARRSSSTRFSAGWAAAAGCWRPSTTACAPTSP